MARITEQRIGDITLFTITNRQGAKVVLSNLGAGIVSVIVPDKDGNMADVVLGYENPEDYHADGPCAGKVPGRYANRIARGRFSIGRKEYTLAVNNGPNHLHGGPTGFQNRIWDAEVHADRHVVFYYRSSDGEEGYPGNVEARATYTFTDDNQLILDFEAISDAKTVINLTNHAYWNLNGHDSGSALQHTLKLNASRWLPTDDTLIPTGELAPVKGTPMDFTEGAVIGSRIHDDFPALRYGKGYDNCWVIDGWHKHTLSEAAVLRGDRSGRVLTVSTTQPGVQVYTGNWLDGSPKGKGGYEYHDYDAVAIECQGCPDAPNQRSFPCQLLGPGEVYEQRIVFAFTTEK